MNTVKYTAQLDGSITATIYSPTGNIQNLTGCEIELRLAREYEDNVIITKQMTVNDTSCTTIFTPTDTEMLEKGNYIIQLIIVDVLGKRNATEKQKILIDDILGV